MRIRRNLCGTVCEADDCQERAEYQLTFGDEPWLSVHLCGKCLKKLGKGIVRFTEHREAEQAAAVKSGRRRAVEKAGAGKDLQNEARG